MLAGAPVGLNVTALRREAVAEDPPVAEDDIAPEDLTTDTDVAAVPSSDGDITETALDPIAGAAAAIEAAAPSAPAAKPAPAPAPKAPKVDKPFIQIGIFSVEANANRAADTMRNAGMSPTVYEQSANGKPFWRVVVGPAQSKSERASLLKKVKATGFSDAYAVTN